MPSARPHAPTSVGGQSYSYDANGNLLSGGNRSYRWTIDNYPASITGPDGITERYGYDANNERVLKQRGAQTTLYLEGVWEEVIGGAQTSAYTFNGQTVAVRQGSAVTYLHGNHLGSISLAVIDRAILIQ